MIWYVTICFALLCAFLAYAAARPDTFRVRRTASIAAPPETIFPFINDFHNWPAWSPYERLDPAMKRTFSGAPKGKGAIYEWSGNRKAGEGCMEIAHASPPSTVVIRLDFIRPFETENIVEFALEPQGHTTKASWSMRGPNPYLAKLMQLFVSMDRMVGKDFEQGLANLKSLAEKEAAHGESRSKPKLVSTG